MDAQRIAIAEACLKGAHDRTMSFPRIVGALIEAGFDGYLVEFVQNHEGRRPSLR